ncbi:MAG: LPS assembly protein LptD, partial [Pseudomonadota bacterium]
PKEVQISPFARTNQTRYWLRSRTDQQFPLGITARLDTDYVSDQDFLREFQGGFFGYEARPNLARVSGRPVEEVESPTRRSALRLSRDTEAYSLQALSAYHERPEDPAQDRTPQPLGALDFALLPRSVPGLPLFANFDTNYDYIWRDSGQKGHRFSLTPEVSYPLFFDRYLQFEPFINFSRNTQWFDDDSEGSGQQSEQAYEIGGRASTVLDRVLDWRWRDVTRLRHKITPSLTYSFREDKGQDRPRPWFEPIDVPGKVNLVTLSLENLLDARRENEKKEVIYNEWVRLLFSQGYDIDRSTKPFDPLVGLVHLMPLHNVDLEAEAHWDHDRGEFSFADLSLGLSVDRSGGRRDRYEVDYQLVRDEGEEREAIRSYIHVNLLYGVAAGTSLRRDIHLRHNIEGTYWLDYQLQCWGVRLITQSLDGVDTISIMFRLVGLGGA